MGPRSCERGNQPQPEPKQPETGSFNGAALVRARKSEIPGHERRRQDVASMGPRSCERGNE